MKRTLYAIALSIAVIAVIAGCGNGAGTTSSAAAPLPKDVFMRKGNALCAKAVKEESDVYQEYVKEVRSEGKPSQREFENFATTQILPIAERMVNELEQLGTPKHDESTVDELIAEFRQGLTIAEKTPPRFFSGEAFKSADDFADECGLTDGGV